MQNCLGVAAKALAVIVALIAGGCAQAVKLAAEGDSRELRQRPESRAVPDNFPGITVIALDGVGRRLFYEELDSGKLPGFRRLLFAKDGKARTYFKSDRMLSSLPSTTMIAWATAFTGMPPAQHGITGNEFFIREERRFAAPVPVTFSDASLVLSNFTEDYANKLRQTPLVYERMRKLEPDVRIWVGMHPLYAGADRLVLTSRGAFFAAFEAFLQKSVRELLEGEAARDVYETLDSEIIDTVIDELEGAAHPDVLTVYLVGIDAYAHVAESGPDQARRTYLQEVLDPAVANLAKALEASGERDRYVIITTDHGHTAVEHDDAHALEVDEAGEPTELLTKIGFRVREAKAGTDEDADFSAVVAYQGAFAYVYLADRSTCPNAGDRCDFKRPPRFEQDVLAAAKAFREASDEGVLVPSLRDSLDAIFVRKPGRVGENAGSLVVLGDNDQLVTLAAFAAERPEYVDLEDRLRQLAEGPAGARSGDILLLANNGNRDNVDERYYFSDTQYHSWHGSPSRRDSEVALVVAHPSVEQPSLQQMVEETLGSAPYQYKLTDLMLRLRYGREAVSTVKKDRLPPWR